MPASAPQSPASISACARRLIPNAAATGASKIGVAHRRPYPEAQRDREREREQFGHRNEQLADTKFLSRIDRLELAEVRRPTRLDAGFDDRGQAERRQQRIQRRYREPRQQPLHRRAKEEKQRDDERQRD